MKIPYIDFRNLKYPIKETIEKELDRVLTGEIKHVKIKHIPSSVFCDATGCKPYDYNGWQCDWWEILNTEDINLRLLAVLGTEQLP